MSKRGQEYSNTAMFFLIAALLIAAVAGVDLLKDTSQRLDGTLLEKNYLARDIALLMDAVYASPGDVEYSYSFFYPYLVDIRKDRVVVRDSEASVEYRIFEVSSSGESYKTFDNPDGFKVAPANVIMEGKLDVSKPVRLVISKKFSGSQAVVEVSAENARLCKIGIDCPVGGVA